MKLNLKTETAYWQHKNYISLFESKTLDPNFQIQIKIE